MINEQINQILLDLNCIAYAYNKENNSIEKTHYSGGSTYGLSELINIVNELNNNSIKYRVDKLQNILII